MTPRLESRSLGGKPTKFLEQVSSQPSVAIGSAAFFAAAQLREQAPEFSPSLRINLIVKISLYIH